MPGIAIGLEATEISKAVSIPEGLTCKLLLILLLLLMIMQLFIIITVVLVVCDKC